jgi:uncharacterized protein (DUF2164 family)
VLPIKLAKENKLAIVHQLQQYFEQERSESIGEMAAEQLLDFILREAGPYLYNQAIADARSFMTEKFHQIDDELYSLEKSTR